MEGIAGVVTNEQVSPASGREYQRFCSLMTDELLACIEGCKAAGATNIVVADSHATGENVLYERMPADVKLVRGLTRPLMMMQGVDQGKHDGAIFLGYHASSTNAEGVLAHTISSALLAEIKLDGVSASEAFLNAACASEYKVPIIMVSGDDALEREIKDQFPFRGTEFAVVKWNHGYHSATHLAPKASCALIREKAFAAVSKIKSFSVPTFPANPTVTVRFKKLLHAELVSLLPFIKRVSGFEIEFTADSHQKIMRFLRFITKYNCTDTGY